jgi:hypothetical protein
MPKFYSNINLKRNELQFPVVHQSSGTPTHSAAEFSLKGQLYFDTGYSGGTGLPLFICTTSGTSESSSGTWKVVDWTHSAVKTGIKVTAANGSTPAYIDNDFSGTYLAALGSNPAADDLMIIQEDAGSNAFKAVKMSELAGYVNGLQSIVSLTGSTSNGISTGTGTANSLHVNSALLFDSSSYALDIGAATNSNGVSITRVARNTGNTNAGAFTITGQNQYNGGDSIDKTGGAVNIYGGRGTGTGVGGSVVLKTAGVAESSGNGLNALSNTWTFASSGTTTFPGAISPASAQNLILSSPEDIHFKIDTDSNSTSQFEWYAGTTEIAALDESGNLQIDGTLTVDGNTFNFDDVGISGIQEHDDVDTGNDGGNSGWANNDVTLATTAAVQAYIDGENFSTATGNTSDGMTHMQFQTDQGPVATAAHLAITSGLEAASQVYTTVTQEGLGAGMTVKFPNADSGATDANDIEIVNRGANYKVTDTFKVEHPSNGSFVVENCIVATLYGAKSATLGSPGTGLLKITGGAGIITNTNDDPTPNTITVSMGNSGVSAATYGSASAVPQITVDTQGRITAAADVSITSANDNTITLAGGAALELDTSGSNGNGSFTLNQNSDEIIALKHSNVAYTATDDGGNDDTLTFGGTFDVLDGITVNAQGHTTGSNATTFTMPSASTEGNNILNITGVASSTSFIRINDDDSVTSLNAADFRSAIGAGTSSTVGTVTGSGSANKVAKYTGAGTAIGDSSITDNGTTVAVTGALTVSGNTDITGNLSVADLTVSGTTTTVNSTVVNVTDPIFTLANYNEVDNKDRGIEFFYGAATESNVSYQVFGNGNTRITSTNHGHSLGSLVSLSGSGWNDAGLTTGTFVIAAVEDDTYTFATPDATEASYSISVANTAATVSPRGFFGMAKAAGRFTVLGEALNTSEVFTGTKMDADFADVYSNGTQLENYTHHSQSAISISDSALTGANVYSNIALEVDAAGHATAASVTSRTLTLGNLGYTGSATANDYTHPSQDAISISDSALTGTSVYSNIALEVNTAGHATAASVTSRTLSLADFSFALRTHACEIDVDEVSGNFANTGNAVITHSWSTQDVIVQCYVGGELIHADVTLTDATVSLHFDKIPATNPTVVIMEAAGTAHTTTVPTYPA